MEVTYFASGGRENTDEAIRIAKAYAEENGISSIIVASTTGYTAEKAATAFKGKNLVIVTHVTGFAGANTQQFPAELRKRLEAAGVHVLTTAHAFGGIGKAVEASAGEVIANTLRMLSEGVKVAVEIALMAADAGLVRTDEDVVAIAGTGRGADTVLVLQPANSSRVFELRVKKILAKPV